MSCLRTGSSHIWIRVEKSEGFPSLPDLPTLHLKRLVDGVVGFPGATAREAGASVIDSPLVWGYLLMNSITLFFDKGLGMKCQLSRPMAAN